MPSDGTLISFRRVPADVRPRALEAFARRLRDRVARGREFHCRVTGDAELRRLNRDFLGHDHATDVLSFPAVDDGSLGDIAVSAARARAQGRRYGHSTENEMRVLMLHGVLHLLGYDHETDAGRMARAEARWRRELGLPGGLIERAAPSAAWGPTQRRRGLGGNAEKGIGRPKSKPEVAEEAEGFAAGAWGRRAAGRTRSR